MKKTTKQQQIQARRNARDAAWFNSARLVQCAATNANDPDHPGLRDGDGYKLTRVYRVLPSLPDNWLTPDGVAETPKDQQPQCYLVAADGYRIHAALMPHVATEWVKPVDYDIPILSGPIEMADRQRKTGHRMTVIVSAGYLEETIHPDAVAIQLSVGAEDDPVEVFSFLEDGTQVSYALVMPACPQDGRYQGQRPRLPRKREKGD